MISVMRKSLFVIILCFFEVVWAQSPAASQPISSELAAVFARAGVNISTVRVETPEAATFPFLLRNCPDRIETLYY
jgi:hypothetical protein